MNTKISFTMELSDKDYINRVTDYLDSLGIDYEEKEE